MSEAEPLPGPKRRRAVNKRVAGARPRYLIVFPEPSEKNASRVASVMRLRENRGASAQASVSVMARGEGSPEVRVFHRLGIAAADLTPEEIAGFRRADGVQVVENETRSLPPLIEVANPAAGVGGEPDPGLVAYLKGLRDGVDLALLRLAGADASDELPDLRLALEPANSWCLKAMRVAGRTRTGKGVRVAVLDTGLASDHPDFRNRSVISESFVPGDGVEDENGHGTHAAGIVVGPLLPRIGAAYGVAPDAELLVGKVLNRNGRGSDDQILAAIDWAVDQRAQVVSMSFGSPRRVGEPYAAAYESVARLLLRAGVLVVAAAGNDSSRPGRIAPVRNPAACPSILAVAAVDKMLRVAPFSCGERDAIGQIDLSGPGVSVRSSWLRWGYKAIDGTSMAAPHVAGAAALFLEGAGSGAGGEQLWTALRAAARPLGASGDFGAGLVQVP
ncbi:MAG: S8 family serine peptidase [Planctomycetes bacterium]|nr:S8 family serine peptidase [Planctomycetota bacterium]